MVNAVMDAIALLSSLATDLDIMLNDLRSSPGSRLLPPTHHLHQRSASNSSNASSSPLTIGGGAGGHGRNLSGGGGAVGSGGGSGGGSYTPTSYLHSALRSNQNNQYEQQQQQASAAQQQQRQVPQLQQEKRPQQQPKRQQQQQHSNRAAKVQIAPAHTTQNATSVTTTITTTNTATTAIPQRYNRYQYQQQQHQQQQKQLQSHRCCASAANACSNQTKSRNAPAGTKATTSTASAKSSSTKSVTKPTTTRQQQKLNQQHAANRLRTTTPTSTTKTNIATPTTPASTTKAANRQTTSTTTGCSGYELVPTAGNAARADDADTARCTGLSADVRRIEKLPLWSYQHKQLQQPQRMQVQLLQQQQRATKAIAAMHTTTTKVNATTNSTAACNKQDAVSSRRKMGGVGSTVTSAVSGGGPYGVSSGCITSAITTTSLTTLTATHLLDYEYGDAMGANGSGDETFRMNWLQPASIYFGFVGRRGLPQRIYCDNATNFVGAHGRLKELQKSIFSTEAIEGIMTYSNNIGFTFSFIPPRAPHFGGLWEAAVKSMKTILIKNTSSANLTYEELQTVVIEVEAILNSRPLVALSDDPNDGEALTPGHLLIGASLLALPDNRFEASEISRLTQWQRITYLKQRFWQLWLRDYVRNLQQRSKWLKPQSNIELGQLVVVHEDNLPPQQWLLGRITQAFPGADGKIRVVEIKTSKGILRRPVQKVAPLPVAS